MGKEKIKNKQYSILKINYSKFKENDGEINIKVDDLRKYKTLNKESELIRAINYLRNNYKLNNEGIEKDIEIYGDYPLIQDLIFIYIDKTSKKYYETEHGTCKINYVNEETKDEITIGYKRLLTSSGHIRNRKVMLVNEKIYADIMEILLCGMAKDMQFKVLAKYNSHFGLCSTDGYPVEMPNIVIVPDYKCKIEECFDVVDEYEQDKYKFELNKKMKKEIMPHDGAGLIDVRRVISYCRNELKLSYIPSSLLVRFLPGGKGNLYTFDINKYAKEKGVTKIVDVWDKEHDLIEEEIDCILTASMFKFWDKYKSFDEWWDSFNTNVKGYQRTFNICKWSERLPDLKDKVRLSYQPLQSLQLSKNQIRILCKDTVNTIKSISTDVDEFIRFRGIDDKKDNDIPEYYKALNVNKDLFYDSWIQDKISQDIEGMKKRAYLGGVICSGNYQVLGIDVVSLAEHAFGKEVKGVLGANQIYSKYWIDKGIKEIGLIRFPHVSHEWKISNVVFPDDIDESDDTKKDFGYLKYQRACICTSIYDSTALRLGGADFDNDHVVSLSNRVLIMSAKDSEKNKNTVLHVETWKENKKEGKKKILRINDLSKIIKTDCDAMTCNIGNFVNKITVLWSLEQTEEIQKYIKIMNVVCSKVIDYAKTGVKAKIPDEIKDILKMNDEKLPYFMKYRYPKKQIKENRINANLRLLNQEPESLFTKTNCTMNNICWHLEEQIANINIEIKDGNINVEKMYKNKPDKYHSRFYKDVLERLKKLKREHDKIAEINSFSDGFSKDAKIENANNYKLFYNYCKNSLLEICPNVDKLLDILVFAFYEDKDFFLQNSDKAILWNCFGTRLRNRVEGITIKVLAGEGNIADFKKKKKRTNNKIKKSLNKERKVDVALVVKKDNEEKLIDITNNINLGFSINDFSYIKKNSVTKEARRLLLVLMALYKIHKENDADFKIYHGGKDKNKIKKIDIRDLAQINYRQYEKYMKEFQEKGVIELSFNNNVKTYLVCKITKIDDFGNKDNQRVVINNLNDCYKIFKKVS